VTAYFLDGQRIDGELDSSELPSDDFTLAVDETNIKSLRVTLDAVKYIVVREERPKTSKQDPRERSKAPKLVLRLVDGTFMHTYRDRFFADAGKTLHVRLWNPGLSALIRVAVSKRALTAVSDFKEGDPTSSGQPTYPFVYAPTERIPTVTYGPSAAAAVDPSLRRLASTYQQILAEIISDPADIGELEAAIRGKLDRLMETEPVPLTPYQKQGIVNLIVQQAVGFGVIDPLLKDPTITEVMVNSPDEIYFERDGRILRSDLRFIDNAEVLTAIHKFVDLAGRRVDQSSPMVDARLADGSRLNAVLPPVSPSGPIVTIRKFSSFAMTMEDLIRETTLSPSMASFLQAAVRGRANILISGGAGVGKTTTMNVLGSMIPASERVITIEDSAELQLDHPHVVTLECRQANVEGRGELNVRELLRNSLRMRPDRILVGEVRGAESLDMLQAMNTGHDGSMSTIHANSAAEALSRLETMVITGSVDMPLLAIRVQMSSSINLFIHQARMIDGTRRILQIAELLHFDPGGVPRLEVIYRFEKHGDAGWFEATGLLPRVLEKMAVHGSTVPTELFDPELTRTPINRRMATTNGQNVIDRDSALALD
jgi:pilus assembly protein CpaF